MSNTSLSNGLARPADVGILAMEVYFPNMFVDQDELEDFDGCSKGKYTIGLGQKEMGFCDDNEDIHSLCLTVVSNLMEKNEISYNDIGRMEVGTETVIDKSKSVKSVLMKLFEESKNFNVEGVDTTNACYGGTSALFNSIAWVESSNWDGRYALVVCGDIAIYAKGNARCTGGAGAIAMLVGPNAPLVMEPGLRYTHVRHSYDFYKPDLSSEYPVVDGKLTLASYIGSLDECYQGYCRKAEQIFDLKENSFGMKDLDYMLFHCPYCKLVQKSVARLLLNDSVRHVPEVSNLLPTELSSVKLKESIGDRSIEKQCTAASEGIFDVKTSPSLMLARRVGNMYTPSLYGCLVSLLHKTPLTDLYGKRICMFSYGSGLVASMFSFRVASSSDNNQQMFTLPRLKHGFVNLNKRLDARKRVSPDEFAAILEKREQVYNKANYTVEGSHDSVHPNTYVLTQVDEMYRRKYKRIQDKDGKPMTNGTK